MDLAETIEAAREAFREMKRLEGDFMEAKRITEAKDRASRDAYDRWDAARRKVLDLIAEDA